MIQKALKFILKDRFGRNSSLKAFLDDLSRHKLFTRSPSIFSDLKTSLRAANEQLGSETSSVIGLTFLFPVGQIWGRSELANCFFVFFNHRATWPYFHRGCKKWADIWSWESSCTPHYISIFNWGLTNFVISSSSRCTRYVTTRKDWDEFKEIIDWKHNKLVLKYFAWIAQPYVNGTWNEVNELFCFYKKIHPVRIQRGKITSEVHAKKIPSRTKNNTQQVGRLRARQRNLQTLRPTNKVRACAAKVRLRV